MSSISTPSPPSPPSEPLLMVSPSLPLSPPLSVLLSLPLSLPPSLPPSTSIDRVLLGLPPVHPPAMLHMPCVITCPLCGPCLPLASRVVACRRQLGSFVHCRRHAATTTAEFCLPHYAHNTSPSSPTACNFAKVRGTSMCKTSADVECETWNGMPCCSPCIPHIRAGFT